MSELSIIITAGGIGRRMGANQPKQFLPLAGKPILLQTLTRLHTFAPDAQFIITLPDEWKGEWKNVCGKHKCDIEHLVVSGGEERFHSVKNALKVCSRTKVCIHDGVRPLVSKEAFDRGLMAMENHLGAVPGIPVLESLRCTDGSTNMAVNRSKYQIIQTPQWYITEHLVKAYEQEFKENFTDDASVFEAAGLSIHIFEGNRENVKITQAEDLEWAEFFLGRH
jgi:2-C-methyl-D-erythritol 4-phosphate cytidylyltransferase